jgi:small subunit ribosomal protein S16
MVKIRLSRQGTKNKPFYRVVAIDERQKIGGEALEILGFWNPAQNQIEISKDRVADWVKKGAFVTPAVKKLIEK